MIDEDDYLTMSMFSTKTDLLLEKLERLHKFLSSGGEYGKSVTVLEALNLIQDLTCEVSSLRHEMTYDRKLP